MCQWYNCMVGCVGLTLFLTKIAALFTYAVNHATCKTVANKGISFLMWFSDPTPLHMALIIHRLYSKSLWRVQLFNALPRMYVVIAVLRLYFIPLRHLLGGKFRFGGPTVRDCHSTLPKPTATLPPMVVHGSPLVFPSVMPMRVASTQPFL